MTITSQEDGLMRALRFTEFGDPGVLHATDVPDPTGTAREAVIRIEAASVNPSDVKNVAGAMDWTVLPRTPGRDFAGVVISGPPEWQGIPVWGTGGDTGFTRDGSHAELMSVPVDALVRKPEQLSFDEASTVGVNFVVAWYGAVETAQLAAGETIAVFGVSGGVGGAVAQIAHALGAKVIGVDRRQPGPRTPAAAVIDDFITFDPAAEVGEFHLAAICQWVSGFADENHGLAHQLTQRYELRPWRGDRDEGQVHLAVGDSGQMPG
jgi:NADPH:quinone reductase-like Zn-dependent oxidoreductase